MKPPYRTTIDDVPLERGLRRDDGWIDMQVQFLIDARAAGSDQLVVGRTVLPPGARHEAHAHPHCDEFLVVTSGHGEIYTNTGREPSRAGDVIFTPRGNFHGFDNTSDEDVVLIWGWSGAGSLDAAGYDLPEDTGVNPKIDTGMRAMLALRDARLNAGEEALGWKVGFGSPAAFERLGTDRPLAGFMLRSNVLPDGATIDISNWTNPALELEVAVYIGADLEIAGVSAAIELVDTTPLSTDPHEILATNIYHRHVILGPIDHAKRDGQGVTGRLLKDGVEIARSDDPTAVTGEIVGVVAQTADLLEHFGAGLSAGDVIITGSVFSPVRVGPGDYETELSPLGSLRVDLTG